MGKLAVKNNSGNSFGNFSLAIYRSNFFSTSILSSGSLYSLHVCSCHLYLLLCLFFKINQLMTVPRDPGGFF